MSYVLTVRTDSADAEVGLYRDGKQVSAKRWHADRNLATELLSVIHQELQAQKADWEDITGLVVFKGPGSFTGLRIGLTVANTIAYGQKVPIVGEQGDDWIATGLARLAEGEDDKIVMPFYGAEANITLPKIK